MPRGVERRAKIVCLTRAFATAGSFDAAVGAARRGTTAGAVSAAITMLNIAAPGAEGGEVMRS